MMFRSIHAWELCLVSFCCLGCSETPSPVRPTRPEADAVIPAEVPDQHPDKSDSVRATAPKRDVDLVEATWTELLSLVEQHKGKIVVVDLWSTACEPCMTEFPHLIELQQRFPDDVVAISFDVDYAGIKNKPPGFYRERVIDFLSAQPENRVLHRMCTIPAEDLFNDIKLDTIPAIYVYGREGNLLKRFDGDGLSYEKQVIPFVGDHVQTAASK